MAQTVEKPAAPAGKTEYNAFVQELPQISKEIDSIIIRGGITKDIYTNQISSDTSVDEFRENFIYRTVNGEEIAQNTTLTSKISISQTLSTAIADYEAAKQHIANTKPHLASYNIDNSKKELQSTVDDLKKSLDTISELIRRMRAVKAAVSNTNSKLYKVRATVNSNNDFPASAENFLQSLVIQENLINAVVSKIEKGLALQSKDVLKRIVLDNAGFIEDPKNPGNFIDPGNIEKDPWGIRFTVTNSVSGSQLVSNVNDLLNKQYKAKTQAGKKAEENTNENKEQSSQEIALNTDLLNDTNIDRRSSYYMNLLPAIRSNLPIQGGTDVPGAQPGLNFRIQHSIVKHKVPGFSPIYQPMGVESIHCTIVGCFTGADGTDIWSPGERAKDRETKGRTTIPLEFTGRGDHFESLTKNIESVQGPRALNQFVGLTRSYDAFQNAQEFYNQVVKDGKQVEVEINLKKNDMVSTGGTDGPFRNKTTGNPFFKALIRQMDLYYVRADRCWYILELEVTDAGLIGEKCLNLTTNINAAADLLLEAQEALQQAGEFDEEFIKCLEEKIDSEGNPVTIQSENKKFTWVIDKNTGYGYRADINGNKTPIRPNDLAQLFEEADKGGSTVSSGNIITNFLSLGFFNDDKFGTTNLVRLYADILSNYTLPKSKPDQALSPSDINTISNGDAYNVDITKPDGSTDTLAYVWDPKTRLFYEQTGSVWGKNFNQDNSLSIEDFLKGVENGYWSRNSNLDFLKQLQDLAIAEGEFLHKDPNNGVLTCLADMASEPVRVLGKNNNSNNDTDSEVVTKNAVSRRPTVQEDPNAEEDLDNTDQSKSAAGDDRQVEGCTEAASGIQEVGTNAATLQAINAETIKSTIREGWFNTIRGTNSFAFSDSYRGTVYPFITTQNRVSSSDFKITPVISRPGDIYQIADKPNEVYVKTEIENKTGSPLVVFNNNGESLTVNEGTFYTKVIINNTGAKKNVPTFKRFNGFTTQEFIEKLKNKPSVPVAEDTPPPSANNNATIPKTIRE